jgi:pimeloyl-ACP methyl ester carboxylesterase
MTKTLATAIAALILTLLSIYRLEQDSTGLRISQMHIGTTPATLYERPGQPGPVVVVAHGFAGSRQIMQAYSLHLAQAGYRVLAYDLQGHGRNPVPMSGDVTAITGTTALLVAETQRVIAAARALAPAGPVALLGHSMATDIIIRAAEAETAAGRPVAAVVAISMFSQAVTAQQPQHLLVITGEWENTLRQAGLDALHLVDPNAAEGDLVTVGQVTRQAVVAPKVDHVGVLFSPAAVQAAQGWLDTRFGRSTPGQPEHRGWWILTLLAGIVLGFAPVVALLPKGPAAPPVPTLRFALAVLLPAVIAPLVLTPVYHNFLPVLVADYLMLHLALYGVLQLVVLGRWPDWRGAVLPAAALTLWGILVFGLALDRYAASFWPTAQRLPIIAALCLGTIPAMIADSHITQAGTAALWRRIAARLGLFASLGLAAALKPQELMFVLIITPVFVLFYLVHGLMGRWVGRQSGAVAAGLGLGLCLAWALGVSFPLFAQN